MQLAGDFVNTGWRIGQYRLANWPIPVGELANTGWRFRQYRRRYIFEDLGRFEVEIEDSKNMEGLRIMPKYGIKNKKNRFGYRIVPVPSYLYSLLFDTFKCFLYGYSMSK